MNPDEILAQLDGDTRAYLQILANAGGEAFTDDPSKPYGSRTPPTCARRSSASSRRTATSRSSRACCPSGARTPSARSTTSACSRRSSARRTRSSRSSSSPRTRTSRSSPSRRRTCGARSSSCRGTLPTTKQTLGKVETLADELGPELPGAAAVRAQPRPGAARDAPGPARDHADHPRRDPAVRADRAQPGRELRGAAEELAPTTSRLDTAFGVINDLLDTLAYNPPGDEEGFLFWTAWANHDAASSSTRGEGPSGRLGSHNAAFVFNTQDAHGPIRRGNFLVDCASLAAVEALVQGLPQLEVLFELLNAPDSDEVCAQQPTPTVPQREEGRDAKAASGGVD